MRLLDEILRRVTKTDFCGPGETPADDKDFPFYAEP